MLGRVAPVIRAIIFDFNGVIADDETPHVYCFQQALAEVGLALTKEDYYGAYLGMDERTCTRMLLDQRECCWINEMGPATRRRCCGSASGKRNSFVPIPLCTSRSSFLVSSTL